MKSALKIEAREMRGNGMTSDEIAKTLFISKSTASLWIRDVTLSDEGISKLLHKKKTARANISADRKSQTSRLLKEMHAGAVTLISDLSNPLRTEMLICAMIYWCEGSKSKNDSEFTFTNSDPGLVATFLSLFRKCFKVDESRLRVLMQLHEYHNEVKQLQFWSETTRIPKQQFLKTYSKPHTGKNKREGYEGCIHIKYYDVNIARQIHAVARAFLETSDQSTNF